MAGVRDYARNEGGGKRPFSLIRECMAYACGEGTPPSEYLLVVSCERFGAVGILGRPMFWKELNLGTLADQMIKAWSAWTQLGARQLSETNPGLYKMALWMAEYGK